jgi:hypothetical protein
MMGEFTFAVESSGDAFAGDPAAEIARILRKTADRVVEKSPELAVVAVGNGVDESLTYSAPLYDYNGNRVGSWSFVTRPRYQATGDASRVICRDCSTRTSAVEIPTFERAEHDVWHDGEIGESPGAAS